MVHISYAAWETAHQCLQGIKLKASEAYHKDCRA